MRVAVLTFFFAVGKYITLTTDIAAKADIAEVVQFSSSLVEEGGRV